MSKGRHRQTLKRNEVGGHKMETKWETHFHSFSGSYFVLESFSLSKDPWPWIHQMRRRGRSKSVHESDSSSQKETKRLIQGISVDIWLVVASGA